MNLLEGNFFTIEKMVVGEGLIQAVLRINPGHPIFEGHFPGQPVVPGVCMIEIIKELIERATSNKTRLVKSEFAKFLAMIDPRRTQMIQAEIKFNVAVTGEMDIVSTLFEEGTTFLKFKGSFKTI
ncbi:MAG: 3-hydroxyacyl-ACP dehydratase [Bacteroidetes bacterium]|nr:MAG: 3-hydroxyacyl-ACP dehydratase [Bacteroidota bacterium]